MAINITTGDVINGTIALVRDNLNTSIAYVAVLSFMGLLLEWGLSQLGGAFSGTAGMPGWLATYLGITAGLGGLLFLVVAVAANFFLWEWMLQSRGYLREGGRRFFGYIGQAIVIALATGIGLALLIVPGLIIGARLAAAPALLIGEKRGAMEAMGESWEMIRGNTTPIVLAYLVGVIVFVVLAGVLTGFSWTGVGTQGPIATFLEQIVSNTATVFTVALGTYVYGQLGGAAEQVAEVFE